MSADSKPRGCLAPLLGVGVIVLIAALGASLKDRGTASGGNCAMVWARKTYDTARQTGVIQNVLAGPPFVVIVEPVRWGVLTPNQQSALMVALDCAVAGNGNHLVAIKVRTSPSGPDLAAWSAVDLMQLRSQRFP